jgi:hypothetical protein
MIENLPETLRRRAAAGASMVELVKLIHQAEQAPPYSRGLVLTWFSRAFGLTARDFTTVILACEIFGDNASLSVADAERLFHARLVELGIIESEGI